MRQIATSTLSNQNIATALNIYTYTADADREMFFRVFADQLAGNGDYVVYATIQRLGEGSAYRVVPITTAAVASGVTSAAFVTTPVPVKNTDVVKLYLTGLAGDTTTPDIVSEAWEADYLRPTTADRTLDVSAGGEAGIDLDNTSGTLAKGTDITGFNDLSAAQVNTEVDTALADVGLTTTITGRIDAAVSTRATPAQVNTEVLDVLTVDTFAEPSSVPAATSTLKDKIGFFFAAIRNKRTTTTTSDVIRNDADSAAIATSTVSDDGTVFTRGEYS